METPGMTPTLHYQLAPCALGQLLLAASRAALPGWHWAISRKPCALNCWPPIRTPRYAATAACTTR